MTSLSCADINGWIKQVKTQACLIHLLPPKLSRKRSLQISPLVESLNYCVPPPFLKNRLTQICRQNLVFLKVAQTSLLDPKIKSQAVE